MTGGLVNFICKLASTAKQRLKPVKKGRCSTAIFWAQLAANYAKGKDGFVGLLFAGRVPMIAAHLPRIIGAANV